MKTLFQIKETLAGSVKRYGRVLSLIVALTALSCSAWGTTYYLMGGTSDNPAQWSKITSNTSLSFDFTSLQNGHTYFGISGSESVSNLYPIDGKTISFNITDPDENWWSFTSKNWSTYKYLDANISNGVSLRLTYDGTTYTLSRATPTPTGDAPVVYWAAYPTMGMNTVNLSGHLHSRDCNTIIGAGFYWSTSHIDVDDVKDIITTGTDTHIIAATSPSSIGTLVAGDNFSAENVNINLEESRSIYLVNYAKTKEGGIGISDEVALSYDYCDPMETGDLTLNNTTVSLPKGAKFKFEAIAHNAGKSPVFEWKDNGTIIEGATTNTLEYEMPDESTHTIRVTVLGRCGNTDKLFVDATVSHCSAAPSVAFGAEVLTATTPWVSVPITITATNVTSAEWSVTPETAELSELTSITGGYTGNFKAPVAAGVASTDYIIEVKGKNNTCTGSVEAVAEHKITVTKDEDTCNNPE